MDPTQILQMIMQLLQGGGFGGGGAFPSGMNRATTGSLQPGLLPGLLGGMMPGMQPTAPPTMLMADMHEMRRRDSMRQRTHDQFYMSPVLERMMTGMGMKESQIRSPSGQLTMMGSMANQLYRGTVGASIGDPFLTQAQRANEMRDIFSGTFFGRGGKDRMMGAGLSEGEIENFTRNQYTQSHGRSIFNRGSSFSAPEMFQVQRMGAQRGLFLGANTGDISRRTEQMARTIKMGQAVFQTMDKEGVLDALQQLTQGAVPMSDTGSLNRVMFQVSAMARSANVSVQLMSRLASEGAAIFQSVGIGGATGANLAMQTARGSQMMTASMGPGQGAMVSAQTVADAGGRQAFSRARQARSARVLGSDYVTENSFIIAELDRMGADARRGQGISDEFFADMKARLGGQGGLIGAGQTTTMMQAVAKHRGIGFGALRQNMKFEKGRATAQMLEGMDPVSRTMLENRLDFETVVSAQFMSQESLRLFRDSKQLSDKQYDGDRVNQIAGALMAQDPSMTKGQARARAEELHNTVVGSKRGDDRFKTWKTRRLEDFHNTRRTASAMEMMEQDRPTGGFLAKVFQGMGGDFSAASFIQGAGEALFGKDMTQRQIERKVLSGEKFIGEPSKRQWADFMHSQASAAVFRKTGAGKGRELFATLSGLTGRVAFSPAKAREDYAVMQDAMKGMGEITLDGVSDQTFKDAEAAIDKFGVDLRAMEKFAQGDEKKRALFLKIAEKNHGDAFDRFKRGMTAIEPDMSGKTDLMKQVEEGSIGMAAAMKIMDELKADPERKMSKEDIKKVNKAFGMKFKNHDEFKKHFAKGVESANKQLKSQLEFKGEVLGARAKSPLFATDVAGHAMDFAGKSEKDLNELLGKGFSEDISAIGDKGLLSLKEAIESGSKEGGKGAMFQFSRELGKLTGRSDITAKQSAAAMALVAKKHGLKLGEQMSGFSFEGKRIKLGQLREAKEAGVFDASKAADKDRKEMITFLKEIAGNTKVTKGTKTTEGGGDTTKGVIPTSKKGPGT